MTTPRPTNTSGPDMTNLTSMMYFNMTTIISSSSMIATDFSTADSGNTKELQLWIIIVCSVVAVLTIIVVLAVIACIVRKRRRPGEAPKPKPQDTTKTYKDERGNTYRHDRKGNKVYVEQEDNFVEDLGHPSVVPKPPPPKQPVNVVSRPQPPRKPPQISYQASNQKTRILGYSQEPGGSKYRDDQENVFDNVFIGEQHLNNSPGTQNDFIQEDYEAVDATGDHGEYYDDAHSDPAQFNIVKQLGHSSVVPKPPLFNKPFNVVSRPQPPKKPLKVPYQAGNQGPQITNQSQTPKGSKYRNDQGNIFDNVHLMKQHLNKSPGTQSTFVQEDYEAVDATGDHGEYYDDAHSGNQLAQNTRYEDDQEDYEYPRPPNTRTSDHYLLPNQQTAVYENDTFKAGAQKQNRVGTTGGRLRFESPYLVKTT